MLHTANYYRNINQNYNEIPPHTGQKAIIKSLHIRNAGEVVEKREPSYPVGGNVNWYSYLREQYGGSLKN